MNISGRDLLWQSIITTGGGGGGGRGGGSNTARCFV